MDANWDQFGPDYDHPPFEAKPHTYLIASTPRCGSHFLGHLLFATGVLGSPLEYFHEGHARRWRELLGAEDFQAMMTALFRRRTSPSGWFGVKAHWGQFVPVARDRDQLAFMNFSRHIEIRRRDRVAQAISHEIARQTKAWISFHRVERTPDYDFARIHETRLALDTHVRRWSDYFRNARIDPIVVEYEDLIGDPEAVVAAILSDFGLAGTENPHRKWLPERQASDINVEWKDRYLADLARQGG